MKSENSDYITETVSHLFKTYLQDGQNLYYYAEN